MHGAPAPTYCARQCLCRSWRYAVWFGFPMAARSARWPVAHIIAGDGLALVCHAQEVAAISGRSHRCRTRNAYVNVLPSIRSREHRGKHVHIDSALHHFSAEGIGQISGDTSIGWRSILCILESNRRRPPLPLAKATQSLASSFQSAVLPVTARKDFLSRSCPSRLKYSLPRSGSFSQA